MAVSSISGAPSTSPTSAKKMSKPRFDCRVNLDARKSSEKISQLGLRSSTSSLPVSRS
jgi:hypothetical protein